MIKVARAPVRITLGGGGTDYPHHYERFGGHVVGSAIRRYVVASIATRPWTSDVEIRSVGRERVGTVSELTDDLMRTTLQEAEISGGVQVCITEDIPAGTGVGSSSAFVVALLAAAYAVTGKRMSPPEIAERACAIEMDRLGRDVGKQDQYLSALGGLQSLVFQRDGTVVARNLSPDGGLAAALAQRIRLYWNGQARLGHQVRTSQMKAVAGAETAGERHDALMRKIADVGAVSLAAIERGDLDAWGAALHEHWCLKRALGVRNHCLSDELYDRVRATAAVSGGKLMGAGGNGIVLFYCRDDGRRADEIMTKAGFTRIAFSPSPRGVEVIGEDGRETEW